MLFDLVLITLFHSYNAGGISTTVPYKEIRREACEQRAANIRQLEDDMPYGVELKAYCVPTK